MPGAPRLRLGRRESQRRSPVSDRDTILRRLVATVDEVECAFLVRPDGRQLTDTHLDPENALAALGHRRFLSERYVSLASGRVVRTLALRIDTTDGGSVILCLDLYETNASSPRERTV